jgi:hypothetical protein
LNGSETFVRFASDQQHFGFEISNPFSHDIRVPFPQREAVRPLGIRMNNLRNLYRIPARNLCKILARR